MTGALGSYRFSHRQIGTQTESVSRLRSTKADDASTNIVTTTHVTHGIVTERLVGALLTKTPGLEPSPGPNVLSLSLSFMVGTNHLF